MGHLTPSTYFNWECQ